MANIKHTHVNGDSPSHAARPASRDAGAFTLVELLVVIVIISMLVGLLLPAVMSARARARTTQCSNNLRELATAIINYETSKKRLPGYANRVQTDSVSWVVALLPFIGRNDIWEGAQGWRANPAVASGQAPVIEQLVCPGISQAPAAPLLHYVVNVGQIVPTDNDISTQHGVFRNRAYGASDISLSDIPSTSMRPLLAESTFLAGTNTVVNRNWADFDDDTTVPVNVTASRLGFVWPATGQQISSILPQIHPDIINVAFCDGHVDGIVAEDVESTCDKYDCSLIN